MGQNADATVAHENDGPISAHPWVTFDVRAIQPGKVRVWRRRDEGPAAAHIAVYTIDRDDLAAVLARDTGVDESVAAEGLAAALGKQSPSIWEASRDAAVVIHPGRVTRDELNSVMEFDTVIHVTVDGRVVVRHDLYGPDEVYDSELPDSSEWILLQGYSGQDRYRGANLHSSELIGGGLARDILATPGLYVALVDYVGVCDECERNDYGSAGADEGHDECSDDHIAGWVVATIPDDIDPATE